MYCVSEKQTFFSKSRRYKIQPVPDHVDKELLFELNTLIYARKHNRCHWTETTHLQTSSGVFADNGKSNYSQLDLQPHFQKRLLTFEPL